MAPVDVEKVYAIFHLFAVTPGRGAATEPYIPAYFLAVAAREVGFYPTTSAIHQFIKSVPTASAGEITFAAFLQFCEDVAHTSRIGRSGVYKLIDDLDTRGGGLISRRELFLILTNGSADISDGEIDAIMELLDPSLCGYVELKDLAALLIENGHQQRSQSRSSRSRSRPDNNNTAAAAPVTAAGDARGDAVSSQQQQEQPERRRHHHHHRHTTHSNSPVPAPEAAAQTEAKKPSPPPPPPPLSEERATTTTTTAATPAAATSAAPTTKASTTTAAAGGGATQSPPRRRVRRFAAGVHRHGSRERRNSEEPAPQPPAPAVAAASSASVGTGAGGYDAAAEPGSGERDRSFKRTDIGSNGEAAYRKYGSLYHRADTFDRTQSALTVDVDGPSSVSATALRHPPSQQQHPQHRGENAVNSNTNTPSRRPHPSHGAATSSPKGPASPLPLKPTASATPTGAASATPAAAADASRQQEEAATAAASPVRAGKEKGDGRESGVGGVNDDDAGSPSGVAAAAPDEGEMDTNYYSKVEGGTTVVRPTRNEAEDATPHRVESPHSTQEAATPAAPSNPPRTKETKTKCCTMF